MKYYLYSCPSCQAEYLLYIKAVSVKCACGKLTQESEIPEHLARRIRDFPKIQLHSSCET